MKKIPLILTLFIAFSCNNTPKQEQQVEPTKTLNQNDEPEKEFIVKLNYKSDQADQFVFTLKNIKVDEFQTKKIIIEEKVSITTSMDEIVANFGDNISNSMFIDLGRKKTKNVLLESVMLSYGKYKLIIQPSDLEKYFKFNNYVSLNLETNTLTTKKIEGRSIPIIRLKQNAFKLLKKENK
ncbi:hypothetical protein [Aurantibacter sp.]|uniref:hypothetical protein n=1 Tax=Aurantibacter sp. TaxID=2807103 RepID=UPI0035C86BF1